MSPYPFANGAVILPGKAQYVSQGENGTVRIGFRMITAVGQVRRIHVLQNITSFHAKFREHDMVFDKYCEVLRAGQDGWPMKRHGPTNVLLIK